MKMTIATTILLTAIFSLYFYCTNDVLAATTTDTIIVSLVVTNSSTTGGGGGGCPPDCPPPATTTQIVITNVTSNPDATSAVLSWDTNLISIGSLEWGLTNAYELGSTVISNIGYTHTYTILGLTEGNRYYFRITAVENGVPTNITTYQGSFVTVDRTPPSNATDFIATYNNATGFIDLTWNNPEDADFEAVKITKSLVFYPVNQNEGSFVYDGRAESDVDSSVTAGRWHYYTLFARDRSGNYSSGIISRAWVPDEDEPEEEPPVDDDPFVNLPYATNTDPLIEKLDVLFFKIIQGGKVTYFTGGVVEIDGSKPFIISVDYDKLPEVLKTIAITLKKPNDAKKTFSFLLKANSNKTEYLATVGPLGNPGLYPLFITVVDYKNQGLKRLSGGLDVSNFKLIVLPAKTKSVIKKVTPVGTIIGYAALFSNIGSLAFNVKSFYDLYLLFLRFIGFLLGFLGIKKKSKPWGTVYDSVTKRPLDPAYVSVTKDNKEVADAITDLDGRYGFLLPKGTYTIVANKTHYKFPSVNLAGKTRDELYSNLYFGENITTNEGEIINKNIPLDPVGFDWNEFVKNKKSLFQVFSRKEKIRNYIFNAFYVVGFGSTAIAYVVTPNLFNALILGSYIILFTLQLFWKYKHRAVSILDSENRDPIPFAIVRLFLPNINQEVKSVVADQWGRFYALVAPGKYYLTVDVKQSDSTYAKVYQSPVLSLPKGVLNENIEVDTKHIEREVRGWI